MIGLSPFAGAQNKKIRVAHLNVGQLSLGKNSHTFIKSCERNEKKKEFKKLLKTISADIIGLCEYSPYFSLNQDETVNMQDKTDKVILKKYRYIGLSGGTDDNSFCIATKKYNLTNKIFTKYSKGKSYLSYDICLNGFSVKVVETHLKTRKYKKDRKRQMEELIKAFQDHSYVIICGDFNVADVTEYDIFKGAGYALANHGTSGDLITCPSIDGGHPYDNIICKGFEISNVQVIETNLSDHYVIICDIMINNKIN